MNYKKLLIIAGIGIITLLFFYYDGQQYLNLETLKQQQQHLTQYYQEKPALTIAIFFLIYVVSTALSLPGATIITLTAGVLFGFFTGLVIASFASSIGATLAFLVSRYLLRESVEEKFSSKIDTINKGLEKEGAFYLFSLRLIPLFPFFLINLLMGLTKMKPLTFYGISQVGMLAGTAVYVNAGTQLATINSVGDIFSPALLGSFIILGLFPLLAKKLIQFFQSRKVYQNYTKPKHFDTNLIVIGAGAGGLVSAYIAAAVKAKVILIEKHQMGGDCLNTGCVPSKALIKSASVAKTIAQAGDYGIQAKVENIDFAAAMKRVHKVIKAIEPHDSIERYESLGVDCIQGEANIISPWEVVVNGKTISARNIIIASGARPFVPNIEGLQEDDYLTSDTLWQLTTPPKQLVVLGGGPIGCELSQAFCRLGINVVQIEMMGSLLGREDPDVSSAVYQQFVSDGIDVKLNTQAIRVSKEGSIRSLICKTNDGEISIEYDQLLIAIGRTANVTGFGLEDLKLQLNPNNTIETNPLLQTNYPNIFAVGDVAGPYQFTHAAAHQAWYAAVNALFGTFKRFSVDYRVIPFATFTHPEIARVGINESEAKAQGIAFEVTKYEIDDLDRAIADGNDYGFVKVLTPPGKDKILGVTIVAANAGDLIAEYVLAMKYNLGLNKILGTIHTYPTMSEANKYVAGMWKQKNKPEKVLKWLEKYHQWMRN